MICEIDFPGLSREIFSSSLIIHVNVMNKDFYLLNSKIISTYINIKNSKYNKFLIM